MNQPQIQPPPIHIFAACLFGTEASAPPQYRLGESLPDRPDTKITNLLFVDGNVEVFARYLNDPTKGIHETLCPPTVTTLFAAGPRAYLDQHLTEMTSGETVREVRDSIGGVWKLNGPVPADSENTMTIIKMALNLDDGVMEIVALPNPGTPLEASFLVFSLLPLSYFRVTADAEIAAWQEIQREMVTFEEEEDEEEEEEEEEEEIAAQPPIPPPPPQPPQQLNGGGVITTDQPEGT